MPYEFQHCHYTAHLDNPDLPDKLALFKVIKDGDLQENLALQTGDTVIVP